MQALEEIAPLVDERVELLFGRIVEKSRISSITLGKKLVLSTFTGVFLAAEDLLPPR